MKWPSSRDFPLLQAIAIVVVVVGVFADLIADLLLAAVNSRIRCKPRETKRPRARYSTISRIAKRVEESLGNAWTKI